VAYASARGRKPMERASKISHAEIISNPSVESFLSSCSVPKPASANTVSGLLQDVPPPVEQPIRAVVAIDGGYREAAVREDYPAAAITFFAFGPLLFKLEALREVSGQPFIAPEDLARLKNIQRYTLVLPTRNISYGGRTLRDSVRRALHEFFCAHHNGDGPLAAALRWLLFRGWVTGGEKSWEIPSCPNYGCTRTNIVLTPQTPDEHACSTCGHPIYLVDSLRLHERVDEEQGAAGITSYVMTLLEQVVLVHVLKALWDLKPTFLREILFIKDGPLAFFGQTAPLSKPMRELAAFLGSRPDGQGGTASLINVVGLEKSGAFVEHAAHIVDRLRPGSVLLLSNDYIYRYIVPGDPTSADPYGKNTYWGGKFIYRAPDENVYVATVPTGDFKPTPAYGDFLNLTQILAVLAELRCSMYDNALIPIALANRLVSLSEFPSTRILETFAREGVAIAGSAQRR
jgi:hypothetical protein